MEDYRGDEDRKRRLYCVQVNPGIEQIPYN